MQRIPRVDIKQIEIEYLPREMSWVFIFRFQLLGTKYIAVHNEESVNLEHDIKQLMVIQNKLQNIVDIRFGATMNGYMNNNPDELFKNAREFFEKHPEYNIFVVEEGANDSN